MVTSTMFRGMVKVTCRGRRESTALRKTTGPAHPVEAGAAHAEFVICDESIEQDHRGVKRVTRPMLGFKSFEAAQATLVGIELMHMIKKDQLVEEARTQCFTPAEQFSSIAT
jgi:putative transposase